MIRAEIGHGNPFRPAVVWYIDNVPALSWSDVGGIVATRTSPAIAAECFPARYMPRVDRRVDVLRRLVGALRAWTGEGSRAISATGGLRP
uniref:hypothetical protein n=1 Tax=Micromonospora sp. NBC_00855 TaxID=2975978 RepID=UPI0037C8DBD8